MTPNNDRTVQDIIDMIKVMPQQQMQPQMPVQSADLSGLRFNPQLMHMMQSPHLSPFERPMQDLRTSQNFAMPYFPAGQHNQWSQWPAMTNQS